MVGKFIAVCKVEALILSVALWELVNGAICVAARISHTFQVIPLIYSGISMKLLPVRRSLLFSPF